VLQNSSCNTPYIPIIEGSKQKGKKNMKGKAWEKDFSRKIQVGSIDIEK